MTPFTKRNFPLMSRVYWDFQQEFGDIERTYAKEGNSEEGTPSQGDYVVPVVRDERK